MKRENDNFEHLVSRSLDDMLNEDEQLELDRELIRCPEARELMESSRRVDELASEALSQALGHAPVAMDLDALPIQHDVTRGPLTVWARRLVPGAVAAALLAFAFARIPLTSDPSTAQPVARNGDRQPIPRVAPQSNVRPMSDVPMRTVGTRHPSVKRNTGRDVFGVIGEDGNIYWIEVDRSRTVRRTKPAYGTEF